MNPTGPPARVVAAYRQGRISLVISRPLIDELVTVRNRPRIARRVANQRTGIAEIRRLITLDAEAVPVFGDLRLCRDPKDDMVLETAMNGRALYVVSRDDDLKRDLDLIEHLRERGIGVLSVAHFLALLEE